MAGNFIGTDRQDLGDPLSRASVPQDLKASTGTVNRAYKQDAMPVGPAENIFKTLYEATGTTLDATNNMAQMKIEEDKTLQTMRFYQGMAPSDDATVAGYRAHAVLGMQNSVLENTATLKNEAATFTGTDAEWDQKVRDSQKATVETAFANHPHLKDDPDTLKAITTLYGEQVPQVAAARVAAKLDQEHQGRILTLSDNILQRMQGLKPEEVKSTLDGVMQHGTPALQLKPKEAEGILVKLAAEKAAVGDLTLLNYTKQYTGNAKTSLFDRTPALQVAENQGQTMYWKQHQAESANIRKATTDWLESAQPSWEQFNQRIAADNKLTFGTAWSDDKALTTFSASQKDKSWQTAGPYAQQQQQDEADLKAGKYKTPGDWFSHISGVNEKAQGAVWDKGGAKAAWDKHMADTAAKVDLGPLVKEFYNPNPVTPLGQTEAGIKNNDAIIVEAKKIRDTAVQAQIAKLGKNASQQDVQALREGAQREYVQYLGRQRVEDKDFSKLLNSVKFTDMADAKNMKNLSGGVEQALSLYSMMPQSARDVHVPDKQVQAVFENFNTFTEEGKSRVTAMQNAIYAYRHPQNVDGVKAAAIIKAANSAANDQTSRFHTLGGFIPFGGETTAPDWYRLVHQQDVYRMTMANTLSGVLDPKKAAELATTAIDNNYTRLPDGKYLQGTPGILSKMMNVVPEEIPKVVQAFLGQNKKALEDMGGVPIDQMYIVTDPSRGTFQVKTALNDTLGAPMPISQMKRGYQGYIEAEKKNGIWHKMYEGLGTGNVAAGMTLGGNPLFSHPENHFEDKDTLFKTIAFVEGHGGYNDKAQSFSPYPDGNGKQHNIGYGHALTPSELSSGYVTVGGRKLSIGNKYASQITPTVARALLEQDLEASTGKLRKSWPGFDDLPAKYKGVLLNLDYNVGSASPVVWPKLKSAMMKGDDLAVRREMVTYYKNPQGTKKYLTGRADIVADRLGLKRK